MGLYPIPCSRCNNCFLWFSGNLDQICAECKRKFNEGETKQIQDLNKEELLGLIYHALPDTLTDIHPCICVSCGKAPADIEGTITVLDKKVYPLWYCCGVCENSNDIDKIGI